MSWYSKKMSCCGPRKKEEVKNVTWEFKHGTHVAAKNFEEALEKLESVISSKKFWSSETHDGHWDVQLSDSVISYDINADSVMEAVRKARWYAYLDNSLKTLKNT